MPRLTETLNKELAAQADHLARVDPTRIIEIRTWIGILEALNEISRQLQAAPERIALATPAAEAPARKAAPKKS